MPLLSRREFLLGTAGISTALALGWLSDPAQAKQPATVSAAVPLHRVVHTHSDQATYWDYTTGWYGDYIRQNIVDAMTDAGVLALTNTTTLADAWHALIPAYTAGHQVAIKINLNNNPAGCEDSGQVIDALPQPINSVVRGLKTIGVAETDICVYDVTHAWHDGGMPTRLVEKVTALYPGVRFYSYSASGCSTTSGYSATEMIHFSPPAGKQPITDRPICNVLVAASYLINMPIMKKHGMAGVTLAFKNHFGSFDGCDNVHWSVTLDDGEYDQTYSGLVDIYNNPHIKNKTVLTVGDGLYGARVNNYDEVPSTWTTFGDHSPNSLFFSIDPVAIDCVMYDHLDAQDGVPPGSDDYLKLASTAGLGTFEHWDAAHLYHSIDYQRIEVNSTASHAYLPLISKNP